MKSLPGETMILDRSTHTLTNRRILQNDNLDMRCIFLQDICFVGYTTIRKPIFLILAGIAAGISAILFFVAREEDNAIYPLFLCVIFVALYFSLAKKSVQAISHSGSKIEWSSYSSSVEVYEKIIAAKAALAGGVAFDGPTAPDIPPTHLDVKGNLGF